MGRSLVQQEYLLHYFNVSDNPQKLEFIIEKDGEMMPTEVKAGSTSTLSMKMFIKIAFFDADRWKHWNHGRPNNSAP